MTPEEFMRSTDVSRETLDALSTYAALLTKWQPRINLVGSKTLPNLWRRHMLDSAQLAPLIPETAKTLVDIGSGGGFPGLVLGIITDLQVHLVESDQRKSAFLREAARATGVSDRVSVLTKRAETLKMSNIDVISSRALAPLEDLLTLSEGLWAPKTIGLFLKGKRHNEELTAANYAWYIESESVPSVTDPDAVILRIQSVRRRNATSSLS